MKIYINKNKITVSVMHTSEGWRWGMQTSRVTWGKNSLKAKNNHMWSGNVYKTANQAYNRGIAACNLLAETNTLPVRCKVLPYTASTLDPKSETK